MMNRRAGFLLFVTGLVLIVRLAILSGTSAQGTKAFQGPSLEEFLTKAKITNLKDIGDGLTLPKKATLELDGLKEYAVFKTIDEYSKVKQLDRGVELEFQDSWKTEIAT